MGKKSRDKGAKKEDKSKKEPTKTASAVVKEAREKTFLACLGIPNQCTAVVLPGVCGTHMEHGRVRCTRGELAFSYDNA